MNHISNDASLWIFPITHQITADEQLSLETKLAEFIANWQSHKIPVKGWSKVIEGRFIAIAGETPEGNISGCSIDLVFKSINQITNSLEIKLGTADQIFYRDPTDSSKIINCSRSEFASKKTNNELSEDTVVFDLTIQRLQELNSNKFELLLKESWMQKL
jgi:hypothetical protein